jgi:hypothetical protein
MGCPRKNERGQGRSPIDAVGTRRNIDERSKFASRIPRIPESDDAQR